ncbi:hypothetical protein [Aquimarina agarivorans]|uniref:hypothetical protein n=1 Tax=Aquimarina agarivorans TaxID=980584 RepID=UPI000248E870|nr:hypothetical protein [Aquimarina agarivorans]
MNNFAQIVPLFKYKYVAYYSVNLDGEGETLYNQFVKNHENSKSKNKLRHILKWISEIGKKYGAQDRFFRNESCIAETHALPPVNAHIAPYFIEKGKKNNLRLYCLKVNEHVVFLFSGAVKTTLKAQDCEQVKPHFELANKLSKAIHIALKEKDIYWNSDYTLLDCDEDFELNY